MKLVFVNGGRELHAIYGAQLGHYEVFEVKGAIGVLAAVAEGRARIIVFDDISAVGSAEEIIEKIHAKVGIILILGNGPRQPGDNVVAETAVKGMYDAILHQPTLEEFLRAIERVEIYAI